MAQEQGEKRIGRGSKRKSCRQHRKQKHRMQWDTKQKPIGSRGIRNRITELGEQGAGSEARTYGVGAWEAGHKELNHLEAGT
jgi:hypothetical protein